MTLSERFWAKVQKTDGCWNWIGAMSIDGYGRMLRGGKNVNAHRIAYELLVGPIPSGLTLDHLCRNRKCVNPSHLEPVTRGENVLRGESPSAIHARKTHCAYGHAFDADNTIRRVIRGRSARICRACEARNNASRQWRTRAS